MKVQSFTNSAIYTSGKWERVIEYLNAHADGWTTARKISAMFDINDRTMRALKEYALTHGLPIISSNDGYKMCRNYEETLEMKRLLEQKLNTLSEKMGLDPAQLSAIAENPSAMTNEERSAVENIKTRFQEIQEDKTNNKQIIK